MKLNRYDAGRIDAPVMTPQGYLKAKGWATRAGVFLYMQQDGSIRRELRPPEEVFHPDSMQSLAEVCVTNDHPSEELNSVNTKKYSVGFVGEKVDRQENFMTVKITVIDAKSIDEIFNGQKQELSCGYNCDIENVTGNYDGQPYDAIQRNIRYNHLAIVPRGRAGSEARVRMDSNSAMMIEEKRDGVENKNQLSSVKDGEEIPMTKIKIDGIEYEVSETVAPLMQVKLDSLDKTVSATSELQKEIETLKGKCDGLDASLKAKDSEIENLKKQDLSETELLKKADAIIKVRDAAKSILGDEVKLDGMSSAEMKKLAVQKALPDLSLESKSDEYISGLFDGVAKAPKTDVLATAIGNVGTTKSDGFVSAADARKKAMERSENAWKVNK